MKATKKLMSEEDVKKALAINSFREVSKEKIIDFISMIPNMDKELAIAIVNQFPAYSEFATTAITILKDMYDSVLEKGEKSHMESISSYRKLLDELSEIAKKESTTEEERKFLVDQMISIAKLISEKDSEYQNRIANFLKYGTTIVGLTILIGASILGINIREKEIPILKQ